MNEIGLALVFLLIAFFLYVFLRLFFNKSVEEISIREEAPVSNEVPSNFKVGRDYDKISDKDIQKEDEVYNLIDKLVTKTKKEYKEENKIDKKNNPKESENVSEEDYYVKDTETGKILKVTEETAKKAAKDYQEHIQEANIYKNSGLEGLELYLKDRPNISRIFNQLINSVDNGYSVKEYLVEANFIGAEDSWVLFQGLKDISSFYKNQLKIKEIPVLRKDYNTCIEAIELLKPIV